MQNAYIESSTGKFQDECLNQHCFSDLAHVRELINQWRIEYNQNRPHSSLCYLTPQEFATDNRKLDSKTTGITKLKLD